jgi:uncharacterized membrane protein
MVRPHEWPSESMRTFKAVALLAALALLLTGSTLVATTPAVPWFSGTIEIAGRHIPLPPGEWLLAGSAQDSAGPAETRPYGAIETRILFKLAGATVEDFITIRANALPVTGSWGPAPECDRTDILFTSVFYRAAHENFCGFVNHVVNGRDIGSSPAWIAALDLAAQNGWRLPATWLMAGFRIADRHDMLDVRYHLNPELAGFARDDADWAASAWSPVRVALDAQRVAVAERLARWVMETGPTIQRAASGVEKGDVVLTLPALADLQAQGKVEATAAPESNLKKAAWKTATFRVVSSTTTFLVALPFTGGVLLDAGLLTLVNAVTHSALYFLHELAWDAFGTAKPRPDLELAGAGISR